MALFFLCFPQLTTFAQADSIYLSLEELFGKGVEQNLQIKADKLKEKIAEEQSGTVRTTRYPNIEIGLRVGFVGQPVVFQQELSDPLYPDAPDWSQNYAVDVVQPIYQGGSIHYNIQHSDLQKQIAALQTSADMAVVKLGLLQSYLKLFDLYKQQEVLSQTITESERRLADIRHMKEEGLITSNDVLRSEIQLTNDRLSLQEAKNSIVLLSQQLDILLDQDENLLIIPDTSLLSEVFEIETYENYLDKAFDNDPDYLLLQYQTQLAQNDIKISQASGLPKLSLYASNTLARPVSRTLDDMYNNNWNIGLSLSYSLSSLYQNKHKVNEAKQTVTLRKNAEDLKAQQMRITIRTAYLRHKEALERVNALILSVKQANENYRIMQNRYYNQLVILTDLLDADNMRLSAELQLINARTHVIYTYYELQKACGRI